VTTPARIVVVGGGITGVAATHRLTELTAGSDTEIVLLETEHRLGGKIKTSSFGGTLVDEGADAFLIRTPHAVQLATDVGLGESLVSPTSASAAIWAGKLYPIPSDLALGVPTSLMSIARSGLIPPAGLARAALDLIRPRSEISHDSIGQWTRSRFGHHVHDRLIDALVGSIYGADTDHFSLAAVPQLHGLAEAGRSAVLAGRRMRSSAPANSGPIFGAPPLGMEQLITSAISHTLDRGAGRVQVLSGARCETLEQTPTGWLVNGIEANGVILAIPAHCAAPLLAGEVATKLRSLETADVAIVTVRVNAAGWHNHLHHRSGYLVPKSQQRLVTAVSFASQKWAHLTQADGSQILRISLGRDGLPIRELDDTALIDHAIEETNEHLGISIERSGARVSRWTDAFTQYRPHHARRITEIERTLPDFLHIAGSSYRGIGIPSCIADGVRAANELLTTLAD
jgi:oxygen-dependent protoporphyrinogen oxidase